MRSTLKRTGALVGAAVVLALAVAAGQDQNPSQVAGRGSVNIFNSVEGRTIVVSSQPGGARVQKGDLLCQLDPSELQDRLAVQEITVQSAEADVHGSRIAREVAVMALTEYKEGFFVQQLVTTQGDIKLAEANLVNGEDALEWTRRMFDKGYVSMATKVAEELKFKTDQFALEQAQSRFKVLSEFTKNKTIKERTGAVETARVRELAKQAVLQQMQSDRKRLVDQIRRCKVVAPVSGVVHHVAPIGPGAVVRDGQLLFQIDPDGESSKAVK